VVERADTLVSSWLQRKWLPFFPIKYDVGYRFVLYSLYYVWYITSFLSFFRAFTLKNVEFCQRLFLHQLKWSCDFCLFFFMFYIIFIDIHMLNHPCILGSWHFIFLMCCWIWYANILLRIFFLIDLIICFIQIRNERR
jgi:hypothetical protein